MDINKYIEIFKSETKNVFEEKIICSGNFEPLQNGTFVLTEHPFTYLINISIYNTIKKYNKIPENEKLFIIPEEGGKSPTDFVLKNKEGKIELRIEHENTRKKNVGNYEKLSNDKKAKNRLLICYACEGCRKVGGEKD